MSAGFPAIVPPPGRGLHRRIEAVWPTAGSRVFQPSRAHLNTLIAAAGPDINARARWLVRNNGYATNAIESWAGNVVGAGIKPVSLIADAALKASVQKLWLDWTDEATPRGSPISTGCSACGARGVHRR